MSGIKIISPYNEAAETYKVIAEREDEVTEFIKTASPVALGQGDFDVMPDTITKNRWHVLLDEAKKLRQDVKNLELRCETEKSRFSRLNKKYDNMSWAYRECQQAMADVTGNPNAGRDYNEELRAYYDHASGELYHEDTGLILTDNEIYQREEDARIRARNNKRYGQPNFTNTSGTYPYPLDKEWDTITDD
jgi:hypothetical protein